MRAHMAGTSRGEQGKTRVTLLWEPLPQSPGLRRDQPLPGRVSLIAANPKRATSCSAAACQTPHPSAPASTTAPGPQRITFDAAPGQLELRMNVEQKPLAERSTGDQHHQGA